MRTSYALPDWNTLAAYGDELNDLPENQRDLPKWSAYARTLLASNELLYVD